MNPHRIRHAAREAHAARIARRERLTLTLCALWLLSTLILAVAGTATGDTALQGAALSSGMLGGIPVLLATRL